MLLKSQLTSCLCVWSSTFKKCTTTALNISFVVQLIFCYVFFVVVALFFKFNFSHYLMCMLAFLFACLCTSLMPGKHRGQEKMSEPLELELQSVVSFFTYWKGKLGVVEDSSLLLTAKVFSNANFLFLVVFPVQCSLASLGQTPD